jgi:hypothetical protein
MVNRLCDIERTRIGSDVLLAMAQIREKLSSGEIIAEDFPMETSGVTSYMPFMNYLQHRYYDSVRRFILLHPMAIEPSGRWEVAGNGVTHGMLVANVRLKSTPHQGSTSFSRHRTNDNGIYIL